MPGEDLFGEQNWDTFSRARTADAYAVAPQQGGPIAGETTFASSSRRDPQAMHRIWAFLQDYKTYEAGIEPETLPIPEYMIRYGREGRSVDLVLDVDAGFLSIYPTGEPDAAEWISVRPAIKELTEQFDQLLGTRRVRDLRPNL